MAGALGARKGRGLWPEAAGGVSQMLISNSWLFVGTVSLGQPSTVHPACQRGLPLAGERPSSAPVWGGPSHYWLRDLPAQAAPAATASRAFPWQSPWAQAWLVRAFVAASCLHCPRLATLPGLVARSLAPLDLSCWRGEPCGWQIGKFRDASPFTTQNAGRHEELVKGSQRKARDF